jgi:quercetin dioxygenase-like cupin family protein
MPPVPQDVPGLESAQVVVPCVDIAGTLAFFTDRLGFRVRVISPADDPAMVVIEGLGIRLRLQRVPSDSSPIPPTLHVLCADPAAIAGGADQIVAPNGSLIMLLPVDPPLELPPVQQELVLCRAGNAPSFNPGRAGMGYRDLVPGRQGGRFIASHIRIAQGGAVPDYVHFHKVRFQMIFCHRGWVRLVYEDQGEPFVLRAGDCVLQPPQIRHRVLECSPGLEVIEVGCPAVHDTFSDPDMSLPTGRVDPHRDFGGQRFVRHITTEAAWEPDRSTGFEYRDLEIAQATSGLAGARVIRPAANQVDVVTETMRGAHDGEFLFVFVRQGSVGLDIDGEAPVQLAHDDAVVVPAGVLHRWSDASADLELLEVSLPATATS